MVQTERRHDRLAVRLSIIISRLLAGETLSVQKLAAEFAVSPRTLRRDFRERLMYMDLEYRNGICRLRSGVSGTQRELDILTFAHRSGLADLFPGLDRRLVSTLLESEASPCLVWPVPSGSSPALALSFYRLIKAITARQQVGLQTEGQRTEYLSPYRLVAQEGAWYREEYAFITEGYYMNKVHWISVRYDLASRDLLMGLMEKSYTGFLCTLTKKQQQLIAGKAQHT